MKQMLKNNKIALTVLMCEIGYNGIVTKKETEDIKRKINSVESDLHKIILFSENEKEKKLRYIVSVSRDSSVEIFKSLIKNLLKKRQKNVSIEYGYPRRDFIANSENQYCAVVSIKQKYNNYYNEISSNTTKLLEDCSMFGIEIKSITKGNHLCVNVCFTINTPISVDSAIDAIKFQLSQSVEQKKFKRTSFFTPHYICSNYSDVSCDEINNIIKSKELESEVFKKFHSSVVLIEQFSVFGKLASKTSNRS